MSSATVSYESAMATLQSMFGGIDRDIIATVLRNNAGHLERTVENLLGMTAGGGGGARLSPYVPRPTTPSGPPDFSLSSSSSSSSSQLPDDFLRPPSYFLNQCNGVTAQSQYEQDAILAQMLQDEWFLQELQEHPEYYMGNTPSHSPVPSPNLAPQSTPGISTSSSSFSRDHHLSPLPTSSATRERAGSTGRGDFSGLGSTSNQSRSSMKERFNSLSAQAKQKILSVAQKLKSDRQGDDYFAMNEETEMTGLRK